MGRRDFRGEGEGAEDEGTMTSFRLRYVKAYRDRHGRVRHYVRRPGHKLVPLPGIPGSDEFMRAYGEALSAAAPRAEVGASRTLAGSVSAMVVGYLSSMAFHNLAAASQNEYRRIFEGVRREYGDLGIATLARKHVVRMLDAKAKHPTAARNFLRCLRLLVHYAISIGIREDDPTAGVRVKVPKTDGFRTWSEEDIAAFEAAYPLGSKPRLALALLLNTALRCADVVKVGRGHVRNGTIHVTAQKTKTPLAIPITPELAEAINAAAPSEHVVFLVSERGQAFTGRGFSQWFRRQCREAGLKGLSAHGLRKATCRRLAEAGCSVNEIAAISGHASLAEVARYTRRADQAKLARNAMAKTRTAT
jgi:integrase